MSFERKLRYESLIIEDEVLIRTRHQLIYVWPFKNQSQLEIVKFIYNIII